MRNPICTNTPGHHGDQPQPYSYASSFVRAFWIIAGIALVVFLIYLSSGHIKLSQSGSEIIVAFIYSAAIGVPSMFLLTWVSHRYTERFPRLIFLAQALILICTATVGSLAAVMILQLAGMAAPGAYWHEFRQSLLFAIVISLMFGLGISSFETMRYKLQEATLELRTKQVEQERAYKLLAEARLSSLESRIHPHFLFNTLNSIAALISSDPKRAEDTVGKLASLLRFSLNAQHRGLVPLSEELKIVRDYLEIERTRFGTRLRYEIDIPPTLDSIKVPPLALQSLVENCVKHVVSQRAQGGQIGISASKVGNRIQLQVLDDGPGFSLDAITPEHGLGNLINRIELLFGSTGQLEVAREGEKTAVRLSFPG
ncbi:MAG: histidine kinase [Terracidiphilus sp.]|jgi:sensor histidine kinase YesM